MEVRANAAQDIENPIAVSLETLRMQKPQPSATGADRCRVCSKVSKCFAQCIYTKPRPRRFAAHHRDLKCLCSRIPDRLQSSRLPACKSSGGWPEFPSPHQQFHQKD